MAMWRNIEHWSEAVKEGVREFSQVAAEEIRHGVGPTGINVMETGMDMSGISDLPEDSTPGLLRDYNDGQQPLGLPHLGSLNNLNPLEIVKKLRPGAQAKEVAEGHASGTKSQGGVVEDTNVTNRTSFSPSALPSAAHHSTSKPDLFKTPGPGTPATPLVTDKSGSPQEHNTGVISTSTGRNPSQNNSPARPRSSKESGGTAGNSSPPSVSGEANATAQQPAAALVSNSQPNFNTLSRASTGSRSSLERPLSSSPGDDSSHKQSAAPAAATASTDQEETRKAYMEIRKAYDDMKVLLKKSMDECVRLSGEVVRLEAQFKEEKSHSADLAAAVKVAKKEAADANVALADTKKEMNSLQKALNKAQHALDSKESERNKAMESAELEALHQELNAAVQKAVAAVQAKEVAEAKAAAAEAARNEAEAAKSEADRLRREAQAEASAALAAAEAERNFRAEAQGLSESLKQDSERRARVFNNAVKAAVNKVQRELEAERDELQVQLRAVQSLLEESKVQLRHAVEAAEEAREEALARTADAEAAGHLAVTAEQAAERARSRESSALALAHAAETARHQAQQAMEQLQAEKQSADGRVESCQQRITGLLSELAALQASSEGRCSDLERELSRQRDRADAAAVALTAAEARVEQLSAAGREVGEAAAAESAALKKRCEELEAEVSQLRTSSTVMSLFTLPSKEDVMQGLGLEMWKDDRLRWKPSDVEASPPRPEPKIRPLPLTGANAASVKRGTIPLRVWLMIAYLSLLHIVVMISFTHKEDVGKLCNCGDFPGMSQTGSNVKQLPGL